MPSALWLVYHVFEENARGFVGGVAMLRGSAVLFAEIMKTGIKPADASHVAYAIIAECDCLLTTDKRLLKYSTEKIRLMNPIEFFSKMEE